MQESFLSDINRLIQEAVALRESAKDHLDPNFRRWRHESESLITAISSTGTRIPCTYRSSSRFYAAGYSGADDKDNLEAFRRDLSDSIVELEFMAKNFGRFDSAASSNLPSVASIPLEVPEKVTIAWLFKNVPVLVWLSGLALLVSAFLLGVKATKIQSIKQLLEQTGIL